LDPSSGAGCFGEKRPDLAFGTKRWQCIEVAPPETRFWKMVMQKNIETSIKNTYLLLGQYWMAALVAVATFSSTPGTSPLKMIPFTDSTLEIPYEM